MAGQAELWECPGCATPLDIAGLGIYARVTCPGCGHIEHVHTMLANFRIDGVLGIGGMSVVLRARDLVLDRPLAIKLLHEHYRGQRERIERFERECELMAKVRHENVVSVYSAGHDKGQFYIAMELIHGKNLEIMVQEQGAMPPAAALDVLRQVVLGLQAAHKAGLLHRDMKPGNIIIADDGHAKVLDFGLSLSTRDEDTEDIIWATPFYVPPETLMREPEDLRTDIYALGMTLRHLLTGRERFAGVDELPQTIPDMLECKRRLLPMAAEMPELEESYCELVDHMTAFAPADRPASYASLLVEIDEVRAALVSAARAGRGLRVRKHLGLAAAVLGTLTLGAASAALVAYLATPAPVRSFIRVDGAPDWPEYGQMAAAMQALQAGDMAGATGLFASLADSEGEATACAWAALHAEMLALLQNQVEGNELSGRMARRFHYHCSRKPASAGEAMHACLQELCRADAKPAHPVLKAQGELKRLQVAAFMCYDEAQVRSLRECRLACKAAGEAYAPLVRSLDSVEKALESNLLRRLERAYQDELGKLSIKSALAFLPRMGKGADEARLRALRVQKEACELLVEAVEMMKRHKLTPLTGETLTPDALQSRLYLMEDERLPEELSTLLLVARGDFAAAAERNPYRSEASSREPFAVLMRDWLERVK